MTAHTRRTHLDNVVSERVVAELKAVLRDARNEADLLLCGGVIDAAL